MPTAIKDSLQEGVATQLSVNQEKTRVEMQVETRVETPDAILALLATDPKLRLREVSVQLGKSLSAIERAAAKLQTEGLLRFEGPKKQGRWIIKG
jgi:predicted HTH transcriptional regulator